MRKDRFTDEALRNARALAELKAQDSESFSEAYDFARCQRPDGSFYGTGGQCRKGTEAGAAPPREGTGARGGRMAADKARAEGKKGAAIRAARAQGAKDAVAAARAEGGAKTSAKNARARMLKDELSKIKDSIKGKSPEEINKAIAAAAERADKRVAAGEGKAAPKKMKTDFRKDVEAGAAKRKARDEKIVARQNRDRELLTSIRGKVAEQSAKKKEVAALERQAKEAARAVKREASKENKEQLKRINAALRIQDRALAKMEREIDKMARERGRLAQQAERERMTPAQRREAARIRKIIKERG